MSYIAPCRGVAQPGSASGLGPEGRKFESCLPDHFLKNYLMLAFAYVDVAFDYVFVFSE